MIMLDDHFDPIVIQVSPTFATRPRFQKFTTFGRR
jgi:hypothetical protein